MNIETANYRELKGYIKRERNSSSEAKSYFGDYTHDSTEELRRSVRKWQAKYSTKKTTCSKEESKDSSVDEVVEILINAVDKLKKLPSYRKVQEAKELHNKAMEIEAELANLD